MSSFEKKENLKNIKRHLERKIESAKRLREIYKFLISKGISKFLVEEIVQELRPILPPDEHALFVLKEIIAKKIKTIPLSAVKKLALVGPTGVGKTTTLLKLYKQLGEERKMGIISLDNEKGGALQQIEKHIPLMDKETVVDTLLIDTSGCNYYEKDRVEALFERLSEFEPVELHLTLSAAAKEVDIYGAIHQFSILNIKSLIFTKLDETLSLGVLLNISSNIDIPISYIAYGYPLPGQIEIARPDEIAHKILTGFNEENFNLLRQLACNNNS